MAGRGLGTLTLELAIKMGGFTAGLDKAGRDLDSRTRAMQRRMDAAGKAIGRSLVAGIGLAAAGLGLYIRNTIEAEKVQAQLASRIKDTGQVAGRTLQQLNAQADKLQGLTIFDDEAIGEAQAALLTFTNVTGQTFDRAIESATDLATVMGTDVADAAKLLGKALSDPEKGLGALRKAGIAFTEQQVELIKNLDKAGKIGQAQGIILDVLASKMGTAAEAARNTLGGALQALQNSFNNLLEGNANDNGMKGARQAIEDLNSEFNDPGLKAGIDNLVSGIARIAGQAALTITALSNLISGVDAFGRTTSEVDYQANLRKELELKAQIDNGGAGPFEPNAGQSVASLKAELRTVQALNDAYRKRADNQRKLAPATPGAAPTPLGGGANPDAGESPDKGGHKRAQVDQLAEAYKRMNEQMAETISLYNQTGEVAKVRYEIEHGELQKLSQAQKDQLIAQAQQIDQLGVEKKAREEAIRLEEDQAKAAKEHAKQIKELLDDIAFETSLTKLSNEEKERAIILRRNLAGATEEEAKRITAATDEMLAAQKSSGELAGAMDEFRQNFEDTVVDVVTGAKSISEAFKSLADAVVAQIARIIAQQLTTSIFGDPGSSGAGTVGGGWLSKIFSIFLPHHATGTDFAPGGPSIVGEHGPEIVNLPRGSQVIPNNRLKGGGDIHITIIGGSNPRETAMQSGRELRRQLAFSGRS